MGKSRATSFRKTRDTFLLPYDQQVIREDELVVLFDLNISEHLHFPYWNYLRFVLDRWTDNDCKSDLEFYKLAAILNIQEKISTGRNLMVLNNFTFLEAFCVSFRLYRFTFEI